MTYEYEIDGVTYVQKPLVLGQLKQLLSLLQRLRIPADADALGVIMAVGNDLPELLAVVLVEKGASPRDKDLAALSERLAFSITMETALQVVEDFFACNPVSSLLERIAGMMTRAILPTGSTSSSSSSPEAISRSATPSSGDVDGTNANGG